MGTSFSLRIYTFAKLILRWARSPCAAEYRRYHVERVGHYGLRSLNYTRHLLRQAGYREEKTTSHKQEQPASAGHGPLDVLTMPWVRKSRILRLYALLCELAQKSTIGYRIIYNLLMEYHRWADRHLPDSYAFSAVFDWTGQALFREKVKVAAMKDSESSAWPPEKEPRKRLNSAEVECGVSTAMARLGSIRIPYCEPTG